MNAIIEQLKDHCDCLPDKLKDEELERAVNELIHLISMMTCWTGSLCETFLNGMREEIFDAERVNSCSCDSDIFEFVPFYVPIYPETITAQLIEQNGLGDKVTDVDSSDIGFSETFEKVRINYQKYLENDNCKCPQGAKLVVRYVAGYEEIPPCLLQLFCDMLRIIVEKLNCDCESCQDCEKGEEVTIEFDDDVSPKLEDYLKDLIAKNYNKQLGLISLCGRLNTVWGVVV